MPESTVTRLKKLGAAARDLAGSVEASLNDQYSVAPEQFPCPPKILQPSAVSTDVNGWTGNFDDEAPWPGEWDNTGGG